ncbi:hypothetical protein AQUCO_02000113v1 [Aquilegia coerulea]|uniref:Uncharacterized protein n=1 Tax=Aquilegia coerulea TaxID=218851 RepID=A0A2G5DG36_AQUCA|nr:hypothetical protein AQUCO_02000113v1 [Aquilegia coerulea]
MNRKSQFHFKHADAQSCSTDSSIYTTRWCYSYSSLSFLSFFYLSPSFFYQFLVLPIIFFFFNTSSPPFIFRYSFQRIQFVGRLLCYQF